MWRSHFDADWERRKNYLIRSLFTDLPLSPVPEEDESFDSNRSRIRPPYSPTSVRPAPRSTHDRPYSPLPPLIIEREPNRHDEPEEYYKKLERKVLKVYRKLFIEGKSDVSDDTSDSGETDVFDTLGRRASFGERNDEDNNFDETQNSDEMPIEIEKSGRKRNSEQNTDIEESDSKKSRSNYDSNTVNRSSCEILRESTDEDEGNNNVTETKSSYTSYTDNSRNTEKINIDEVDDNVSDSYSADRNKNIEVQNKEVENQTDTSTYPTDNSRNKSSDSEVNGTSDTLNTHSENSRNKEKDIEAVDDVSNTTSSKLGSRNNDTRSEESDAGSNHKDHRIVTILADVHKDAADDDEIVGAPSFHQSVDITVDKTAEIVSDADLTLLENNAVSDHSHTHLSEVIPETEVMLSTQTRLSVGSHNQDNATPDSESTDIEMDLELQLEELTDSDPSNLENNVKDVENSPSRNRSISVSNDSIYEVGTQTSLDYNCYERVNEGILRDIFVGAPKVFRLCSCVNHYCVC